MAKWAEIKCERCAEQDALWEGMERALEESDAREARLEARFGMVRSEVVRLSAEGKIDSEATERMLAAIRKGGE